MNEKRTIHVGIASRKAIRDRTIAIAAGKIKPLPNEPKVWLTSPSEIAQVLSKENIDLIHTIQSKHPDSVSSLALETGRSQGNLSRTLKRLVELGIVDMVKEDKRSRPIVLADRMQLDIEFADA